MAIYREELEGFGPTLASEKLAERKLVVDHETLRRWLLAAGLWQRERRRGKYRRRRARKEHFGELVQLDGSHHEWFGGTRRYCLLSMVDDATSRRHSLISAEETTESAMRLLWRWVLRYGVPRALYCDRKNVYVTDREPTLEEDLAGEPALTAFGKACRKLGIEIIAASSPQAKGRVERSHGVYQDRLVKELRLRKITTLESANELLDAGGFDAELNRRFAKPPASALDLHQAISKRVDLAGVFAYEQTRRVQNDWTVRFENRWLQIGGSKRVGLRRAAGSSCRNASMALCGCSTATSSSTSKSSRSAPCRLPPPPPAHRLLPRRRSAARLRHSPGQRRTTPGE